MEKKILFDNGRTEVIAVYNKGNLMYTKTIIWDVNGWIEKVIIVNSDGTYGIV